MIKSWVHKAYDLVKEGMGIDQYPGLDNDTDA